MKITADTTTTPYTAVITVDHEESFEIKVKATLLQIEQINKPSFSGPTVNWRFIQYGNGIWMATQRYGFVITSSNNGTGWINRSNTLDSVVYADSWWMASYGSGKWMAIHSDGTTAYSTNDGSNWTKAANADISNYTIAYGNNKWMIVNGGGTVALSTDSFGTSWTTNSSLNAVATSGWTGASYGNGKWIAVNGSGTIAISTDDGESWPETNSVLNNLQNSGWFMANYGNGKWLSLNNSGHIAISLDDGVNWSLAEQSLGFIASSGWNAVSYGGGIWMAASDGIYIARWNDAELTTVHSIVHTAADGISSITTDISTDNPYTSIIVDPTTHDYVEHTDLNEKKYYTITFQLNSVEILDEFPKCKYIKSRLPQHSRVVDFSRMSKTTGKFVYNISGLDTDSLENGLILLSNNATGDISNVGMRWNETVGLWEYWANAQETSGAVTLSFSHNNIFSVHGLPGDFFWIAEILKSQSPQQYMYWWSSGAIANPVQYLGGGLYRTFYPFNERFVRSSPFAGWPVNHSEYPFRLYNCSENAIFGLMAGVTLPINAVLFAGVGRGGQNPAGWYGVETVGDTVVPDCNNNAALQRITTSSAAKLKADYLSESQTGAESNIRIYVIKYRKQTQYKDRMTDSTDSSFDYSYIDTCASAPDYVYDVDTDSYKQGTGSVDTTTATAEENLAKALSSIAADIKTFAGHSAAAVPSQPVEQ
jgi:hypothetical protein